MKYLTEDKAKEQWPDTNLSGLPSMTINGQTKYQIGSNPTLAKKKSTPTATDTGGTGFNPFAGLTNMLNAMGSSANTMVPTGQGGAFLPANKMMSIGQKKTPTNVQNSGYNSFQNQMSPFGSNLAPGQNLSNWNQGSRTLGSVNYDAIAAAQQMMAAGMDVPDYLKPKITSGQLTTLTGHTSGPGGSGYKTADSPLGIAGAAGISQNDITQALQRIGKESPGSTMYNYYASLLKKAGINIPGTTSTSAQKNTFTIPGTGQTSSLANKSFSGGSSSSGVPALDNIINMLSGQLGTQQGNALHQYNTQTGSQLDQMQQQAAASGNLDRFGGQAAQYLGAAEQGRQNAMQQGQYNNVTQLLQALGLQTDLAAKLAQAQAQSQSMYPSLY